MSMKPLMTVEKLHRHTPLAENPPTFSHILQVK